MRVDADHFAIRFLVPSLTIALVLIVHLGGTYVFAEMQSEVNTLCIVLPLDAVVLVTAGSLIERVLKHWLPSRRSARLSDDALTIHDGRHKPPKVSRVEWDRTVNFKTWRFIVRRRTRVPKGWYCMAVQLLQDEEDLIFYTFMSQQDAEAVSGYDHFTRLRPRRETESNTDLRAVAEQRRLLKLEDARWQDGAELSREDFRAIVDVLQRRVAGWN
jgi:hypothetical protein